MSCVLATRIVAAAGPRSSCRASSSHCTRCICGPTARRKPLTVSLSSPSKLAGHLPHTCTRISRSVTAHAQDQDRNLVQADLYVLVSICLTFQILTVIAAPGFSWWSAPRVNPGRFASFLQLGGTATISWLTANLVVGNFQNSVVADVRETFRRVILAYIISLPVTSCQLELQHMASGWTAVDAVGIRRVAGVLGAMCLWRVGFSLYYEHWTSSIFSGYWLGGEGGPETRKALQSIAVAVLIFILTWEFCTRQLLQPGSFDSFAKSLIHNPGSLLE